MRKYLFVMLLCLSLFSRAQIYNLSGGEALQNASTPLHPIQSFEVHFTVFPVPTLPGDAVIYGLYPAQIITTVVGQSFHYVSSSSGVFDYPRGLGTFENISRQTMFSVTNKSGGFTGLGSNTSVLSTLNLSVSVAQSLLIVPHNPIDTIDVWGVGVAVIYTSASATTDPQMPQPFPYSLLPAPPAGKSYGLAWSLPTTCSTVGAGDSQGTATCLPRVGTGCIKNLTGTLTLPDGTGINGYMQIKLPTARYIGINFLTTGGVVPPFSKQLPIVNGTIIGGATLNALSNDCISPRYAYNVTVVDTKNNYQFSQNWYLPLDANINIDVGTLVVTRMNRGN